MNYNLSSSIKDADFEIIFCLLDDNEKIISKSSEKTSKLLENAAKSKTFNAKRETSLAFLGNEDVAKNTLAVGLGKESELFELEYFRRAGAISFRALAKLKAKNVTVDFSYFDKQGWSTNMHKFISSFYEGFKLASYKFSEFNKKKEVYKFQELTVVVPEKYFEKSKEALRISEGMCDGVEVSRWLGDNPGNKINPKTLSEFVKEKFKNTDIKVDVWERDRLKKEQMELLLGVGQGSSVDPRLIVLEYKNSDSAPVCFVGKGITFDSGGISLKPSLHMEEMKFDMCGAANVIGTICALEKIKAKVNIICIVATAENLPGPSATKPGDIHRGRSGLYVEVQNTDAEGRLVLADALTLASEKKPKFIVDAATLTGAMVIALGKFHVGYFTRDEKLNESIQKALKHTGESAWRLPLTESHRKLMKGDYSDLKNIAATRECGSAQGAAFLSYFVEKEIPWAHFDIAGVAWNAGSEYPYCNSKGASGIIVRTFCQLAINESL